MTTRLVRSPDDLLLPKEVAAIFRVDPKTVNRWVKSGRVPAVRTPGGQHRIRWGDVVAVFRDANEVSE